MTRSSFTTCRASISRAQRRRPPLSIRRKTSHAASAPFLEPGKAVVALHHALAGWPTWDEYGDWLGGRFLYRPARVRGEMRLDSGYARAVAQEFETLVAHPVLKGLPPRFWLTDEPYLCEVFECDIRPPLRSSASFQREDFLSAAAAVAGRMEGNSGWATRRGRMPSPGRSARSTARSSTSSQATSGRLLKIGIAGALSKTRSGGRSRRAGVTER